MSLRGLDLITVRTFLPSAKKCDVLRQAVLQCPETSSITLRGMYSLESGLFAHDLRADLAAARAGESQALGRVLQGCRAYLLTVANAELDADLVVKGGASDLVQESLMEAQQAFGAFAGSDEEEFLHWLRRILKNNLVDLVRRYRGTLARNIGQEVRLDRSGATPLRQQLTAGGGSPLEGLLALEKSLALEAGLARLPEEYRRVIDLRHMQGQTFPQIGAALGKSAEAARKVWFRALRQLRHELKRHEEFGSST